ncbi:hypothetical protein [Thiohalorhabdus methylotrophus]|uniref:Lipocalin-like domain-containing protein n=1 Tax=Thiohalorhabdus methylotrophus TaxID=3242694 RepID=A0ABV4TR42_9GAMM
MRKFACVLAGVLLGAFLLAACSGGGSGSSDSEHPLTGVWYGVADDITDAGSYKTIRLTFDSNGAITKIEIDGAVTGNTAALNDESQRLYDYTDAAGDTLAVYADSGHEHIAIADSTAVVGVLEKGASALSTYSVQDAAGSYDGEGIALYGDFTLAGRADTRTAITGSSAPLAFSYEDGSGCKDSGTINAPDSSYGVFPGTFTNNSGPNCISGGDLRHYLTPDKAFAFTVGCTSLTDAAYPDDCALIAHSRD